MKNPHLNTSNKEEVWTLARTYAATSDWRNQPELTNLGVKQPKNSQLASFFFPTSFCLGHCYHLLPFLCPVTIVCLSVCAACHGVFVSVCSLLWCVCQCVQLVMVCLSVCAACHGVFVSVCSLSWCVRQCVQLVMVCLSVCAAVVSAEPHDATSITLALRTLGSFDFEGNVMCLCVWIANQFVALI